MNTDLFKRSYHRGQSPLAMESIVGITTLCLISIVMPPRLCSKSKTHCYLLPMGCLLCFTWVIYAKRNGSLGSQALMIGYQNLRSRQPISKWYLSTTQQRFNIHCLVRITKSHNSNPYDDCIWFTGRAELAYILRQELLFSIRI